MKSTFILLSYLLLAFSTNHILASADDTFDAVLDISGDELRPGVEYYILPVVRGRGGGLTIGTTRNVRCLYDVVQERSEIEDGYPVTFSPVNPSEDVVRLNADLNVEFSVMTTCIVSTLWQLDNYKGQYIVSTGGTKGNPGRETLSNWFQIEKEGDDYKLFYCPTVCDTCRPVCGNIGVHILEDGTRRLGLSEVPFRVMFKKAEVLSA